MHVNTVKNQSVTPEWIQNSAVFLSERWHVYFCISINQSMLTFKLVSCCRLKDEQICHYDDKQITSQLCLDSSLMSMKKWKGPFAFYRKSPSAHEQPAVWCLEMWHHATNKSQSLKGYMLFSLLLPLPACTQAHSVQATQRRLVV